jgi:hypothetical protein
VVVLVDTVIAVDVLSQMVLFGELITGVGSTVTTTAIGAPEHNNVPGAVPVHGVMLYVTVWAVAPVLSSVWAIVAAGRVPVRGPLAAPTIFAPTPLTVQV